MDFSLSNKLFYQRISKIDSEYILYNRAFELDPKFFDIDIYRLDKYGNLTNNWLLLSTSESPDLSRRMVINAPNLDYVLLFGCVITLSKSANVIETQIKGHDSPLYQLYNNNSFDINVNFLESGPSFFQQNTKQIRSLINILDKPQSLFVTSPLLNYVYDINKVICFNYNIGQDERFYSHTPISITLKSDKPIDIIQKTTSL